jgi:hypothetical protein
VKRPWVMKMGIANLPLLAHVSPTGELEDSTIAR